MPDIIRDDDAHYAYEIVERICEQVGPGLPGSSQEWERAGLIRKELESHLGAENVVVEKFTLAPWAALGALRMSALLMLLATLLNLVAARLAGIEAWLTAVAALVLSILSPFPYFLEDILGFESIDRLFRKKESVNVIGRLIKPGTT